MKMYFFGGNFGLFSDLHNYLLLNDHKISVGSALPENLTLIKTNLAQFEFCPFCVFQCFFGSFRARSLLSTPKTSVMIVLTVRNRDSKFLTGYSLSFR